MVVNRHANVVVDMLGQMIVNRLVGVYIVSVSFLHLALAPSSLLGGTQLLALIRPSGTQPSSQDLENHRKHTGQPLKHYTTRTHDKTTRTYYRTN